MTKQSSWTLGGLLFVCFATSPLQAHTFHPQTLWSSPKIDENVIGVAVGHLVKTDEVHLATLSPTRLTIYALQEQTLNKSSSIQARKGDQWVKLSLADIDADGIGEVVVSGFRGDRPHSFLLSAKGGPIRTLSETTAHLAVIPWKGEKTLFSQKSVGGDDFTGPLRKMRWDGKKLTEIERVELPGGFSGESPSLFRSDGFSPAIHEVCLLYQSETGPLVSYRLLEGTWKKDWMSGASYGGFSIHLDREVRSPLNQVEKGRFLVPVSMQIISTEIPIAIAPVVIPPKGAPLGPATSETNLSPPSMGGVSGETSARRQKANRALFPDARSPEEGALWAATELATGEGGPGTILTPTLVRQAHHDVSPPQRGPLRGQGRGGVEADNRLRLYVVRQEGYLHNVIGALPSAKNSQVVRLVWSGYGFQEDWNSPRFDGAIADFSLVDWDGDGQEEILASLLLRDGGYFDTLKKQDSILIVIDVP